MEMTARAEVIARLSRNSVREAPLQEHLGLDSFAVVVKSDTNVELRHMPRYRRFVSIVSCYL